MTSCSSGKLVLMRPTIHRLILLRHAKAESPMGGQTDLDRPLADSGLADAETVGSWLAAHDYQPDLVLCSPARRTRETWRAALEGMRRAGVIVDPPVAYERGLYSEGAETTLRMVAEIPDEIKTLVVVGHNPTVSIVSAALDPEGGHGNGLGTASLAVHEFPGPWSDCDRGRLPLVIVHTARAVQRAR